MLISGKLGLSGLGAFELGKPKPRGSGGGGGGGGSTVYGDMRCDVGITLCVFEASHGPSVQEGDCHVDVTTTCTFVGQHKIRAFFQCDETVAVFWISGLGAVAITCLVDGSTAVSTPLSTFLFDAPYSY
jgi:hypothetical protein